jgi:hypothetical protein
MPSDELGRASTRERLTPRRDEAHEHHADERRHQQCDGRDEVDVQVGQAGSFRSRRFLERVSPKRDLCKAGAALGVLLALGIVAAGVAHAAEPEGYRVRARVAGEAGRVEGELTVRVRLADGEDHVRLWLYGERLGVPPSAMDERSARWVYPGEVSRGGIRLSDVTVDGERVPLPEPEAQPSGTARGIDVAGADVRVPIEPGPARTVELALRFVLTVPGRFGRLGRVDDGMTLAAPWYPLVVDGDAWAFEVPHDVEVEADRGALLLGGRTIGRTGRAQRTGAYVPLAAAPRFFSEHETIEGVRVSVVTTARMYRPPPSARRGEAGLLDLAHVDVMGRLREVIGPLLVSARALGVAVPDELVLWQIPSRTELVATAPGVVLVSDRLFQIFPIDQTLDFHRGALRRGLARHLVEPGTARTESVADRGWAADLRAVVLVDLDEARRRSGAQRPEELLGVFAFHPAVDQLLYAPQIAFEDTYFAAIEERDPFRDDPVRSRAPISSGRRILESARDALDEDTFRRFVARLIRARRPVREVLRAVAPERVDRLASWRAATGEPVNYRLGAITSRRLEDGRYEHTIEILRDGSERAEPVEVDVHDATGHRERAVWDAPGARGEVTVVTPGSFGGAQLDPRQRLPQSPVLAEGHPRRDDATDHPFRPPILNGFLLNFFATETLFTGLVDFAVRRRYDLEHTLGLRLERTFAFTGGALRYSYGFGPKAHDNRRIGLLTAGLSFERLHEGFAGDIGAWRGQLFLQGGINTVRFALDPREGVWLTGRVVGGLAVRDDGTLGGNVRGGVRGGVVFPLGLVNALVLVAGGGFTAGDALPSELQSLGGGPVLRGFESDELLGRGALYAVAEHRWTAVRDLAWNLAHLVWVRELQLAAFAGAGIVLDTVDGQTVAGGVEVGGGVRVHYEYGGVQPGVIAIDVGVPVTREDARVIQDGVVVRTRAPVGFFVSFDQYF